MKWIAFAEGAIVIFDTDILIWVERGNLKAARLIERSEERLISVQTYMELLQCAKNRDQQNISRRFLKDFGFKTLPFTENIGHRSSIYIEEYALSDGLRAGDAVIAATATENHLTLCSGNVKHFKFIQDLEFKPFRP